GRRRLHLRFPRTPIIYGAFSQRLRIRNGIPLSRLYRAGFDAASPPISGDAGDDLDTEFSIWQPFLRHSLWNARNHSRCASKNGPSVAVLGIRFGDGSEIGPHGIYVGAIARLFSDYSGETTRCWLKTFSYTRSVVLSAVVVAGGIGLGIPLVVRYIRSGFRLSAIFPADHLAVAGLLLVIGGFMNFTFTLAIHAAAAHLKRRLNGAPGR